MATILHLFSQVSLGGACRAAVALAKYSSRLDGHRHVIGQLSAARLDPEFVKFALHEGIEVLPHCTPEELSSCIAAVDIVQLSWWNAPMNYEFIKRPLPPTRLVSWFHIGGHTPPHEIFDDVADFFDLSVACSPLTLDTPALKRLTQASNGARTGMAYGAADFERVANITPKPHAGFNIGYIGTVDYLKMHPDYIALSAQVQIPGVQFVVCGSGGHLEDLKTKAAALGISNRFKFRGYVKDIRPVLAEMDVYGYPLCEETYAAAEVNLQEVMFCGIPPVVFPYGGLKYLVEHNVTGLLVHSAAEYKQALEYLYHNPEERRRLGENARQYARSVFGAENAAKAFSPLYSRLLSQSKRARQIWQPERPNESGASLFIQSLGSAAQPFLTSYTADPQSCATLIAAEHEIAHSSQVIISNGILQYAKHFTADPYLQLWAGIALLEQQQWENAANHMVAAINAGLPAWRGWWYIAQLMQAVGDIQCAREMLERVRNEVPHFEAPSQILAGLR